MTVSFCPYPIFDSSQSLSTAAVRGVHLVRLNPDNMMDVVVSRYRDYNEIWLSR